MQTTNYKDVRKIILDKKKTTPADDFFVIIKPDKDATYKNAVDVLDEMSINDIAGMQWLILRPMNIVKFRQLNRRVE